MRARFLGLIAALCCAGISAADAAPDPPIGVLGPEDHRVPIEPDRFPWSSIGRINRAGSGFCTASLVGPRQVLTAAHCLYDPRTRRWVRPDEIHFLAGYARGDFRAHAVGAEFTVAPGYAFDHAPGRADLARDWVVVTLREAVPLEPIAWRAIATEALPAALAAGELMRAGYGRDRAHLLAMHRGCKVTGAMADGAVLLHRCDSAEGDSGSPLLLFTKGRPAIIGIHVAILGIGEARVAAAVPASAFDAALRRTVRPR